MNKRREMLPGALLGFLVGGIFLACDGISGSELPAITSGGTERVRPEGSRQATDAEETDGTYEFNFTGDILTVRGDCDGITYRAPVTSKSGTTLEWTSVYEYFSSEADAWETRFLRAGIPPKYVIKNISHYPWIWCEVRVASNLLEKRPYRVD